MSTTVDRDADGVSLSDLSLGDVVVVNREIDLDGARTFATVIDAGEYGPLVAGPTIETATLARALTVERVTHYDQVVGQDATGAIHLLQQGAFVDTLDVLAEPDAEPAPRQFLRKGSLQQWLQFVDERRGWQSLPERHRAVLDDVDRGDGVRTDGGHSGNGSERSGRWSMWR